jgi:predicted nucleic acid-binding protein
MAEHAAFFDTNILLYLLSEDQAKADRAEELLAAGGVVSVQVLNEFVSVASRKRAMTWTEIKDALEPLRMTLRVEPVTVDTHSSALRIAERYNISFYDALVVAAAELSRCAVLYSEDLQHGQVFEKSLTVRHPFRE